MIDQILINEEFEKRECERSLEQFTKMAWDIIEPGTPLSWNWHLSTVCGYLEAFHRGDIEKRLIINIPPGSLKSILVSVMFPSWQWISSPEERYLTMTNEQGLAIRDALRMKQFITSDWFQSKWPVALRADQNEKTLFANEKNGFRQSQGITGATTGKRGSCLILDDVLDSKQAFSDVIRQSVNDTYDQTLSTRLNNPNTSGILLIMQRLHEGDLTGHLLKKSKTKWTNLSIPMEFENAPQFDAGKDIGRPELNDPRTEKGELLFPVRFSRSVVEGLKEDLGEYGSCGQMQQRPVPSGGGIIKSYWWRMWPDDKKPPVCDHVFLSYDTAFSERDMKNAAFSAMTRWGVFWHEQRERYCLICLGCWHGRVGYDELRRQAKEWDKEYEPDTHLIEKKATGISLIQDLKRAVPTKIRSYSPGRGEDKISRAHSVSPMFESGLIYIPNKAWAMKQQDFGEDGLIDYVAKFPSGEPPSADYTDSTTQACIYLRSGSWVTHPDDSDFEQPERIEREAAYG